MAEAERPITHGRVLKIALPIVLSNATVPILGAVDTGVIGQLGQAAPIGAVGVGAVILSTLYWVFGFLRMGTTGLTGQAAGAGRDGEVTALLVRALMIGVAAGAGIIALQALLFLGAFAITPASDEVEALARDYMAIRVWSAPAAIALYGINGWLIALERTRSVLLIQLWMNGFNIVLDLWFVLGLGAGVTGVAWATFIAEWSGLGFALWLCRGAFANPAWRDWARVFDAKAVRHMMGVNTDILLRSLALMTIMTSFTLLGARFGDVVLAANHVLMQFISIIAFALDGFAFAVEALVAGAFGARSVPRIRRAIWLSSIWAGIGAVLLAAVFWIFGGAIIDLMATAPGVRLEARDYLAYMVLAPLVGLPAWMLDGIFIGATRGRDMRNMMAISALVYAGCVMAFLPVFGNDGLWLALLLSFVVRGVTLGSRYPGLERAAAG
ncbi:MATE family efflux transporter [Mesobacterium pallidum]|uniref:MATE family efflux transporter n=1 Tax=Mesobacterium pallidum TaxID=2872037 RepID=UPI001EE309A0|nr:MATE family efflux transporter [Mesobacterium pallidum]